MTHIPSWHCFEHHWHHRSMGTRHSFPFWTANGLRGHHQPGRHQEDDRYRGKDSHPMGIREKGSGRLVFTELDSRGCPRL